VSGKYVLSDDPNDPCGYCVSWVESDDPVKAAIGEDATPILPSGPVDRIYRHVPRRLRGGGHGLRL